MVQRDITAQEAMSSQQHSTESHRCQIAVVGHDSEEVAFHVAHSQKEEHLDHVAGKEDVPQLGEGVQQSLGHRDGGKAFAHQGQLDEEKVHGDAELGVKSHHDQQEGVAGHFHQVDNQDTMECGQQEMSVSHCTECRKFFWIAGFMINVCDSVSFSGV